MAKKKVIEPSAADILYILQPISGEPLDKENRILFGYDYVRSSGKITCVKIDVEYLFADYADMGLRYRYPVNLPGKMLPDKDFFYSILSFTLNDSKEAFYRFFEEKKLEAPPQIEYPDDFIREDAAGFAHEMALNINLEQQPDMIDMHEPLFTLPCMPEPYEFFHGTFIVISILTMLNRSCDRFHNREMLLKHLYLPFARFNSLRLDAEKKMERKKTTTFSVIQTGVIFALADCVAQVFLTPSIVDFHSDYFEKFGMDKIMRERYMTLATYFRKMLNEEFAQTKSSINILNQNIDWGSLIK